MMILLVLLALTVLVAVAAVCAFHLAVGNGRFESLDSSSWDACFGAEPCEESDAAIDRAKQ
jgi:nitrogen fixation-related uncharacterized protein